MDNVVNRHYGTDNHVAVGPGTVNLNVQPLLEQSIQSQSVRYKPDFSQEEDKCGAGIAVPLFLAGPIEALLEIMQSEMQFNSGYTTLEEITPTDFFKPMSPHLKCRICDMLLWVLTRPTNVEECIEYFKERSMTAKEMFILIRELFNRFEKQLLAYRSFDYKLWEGTSLTYPNEIWADYYNKNPAEFKVYAKAQCAMLRSIVRTGGKFYLHNYFNFIMYYSIMIMREFVARKIGNCQLNPTDEMFFVRAMSDPRWGQHVKKVLYAYCQGLSHNLFNLDAWVDHMVGYSTSEELRKAEILTNYRSACMRNLIITNEVRAFNVTIEASVFKEEAQELNPMFSWYSDPPH